MKYNRVLKGFLKGKSIPLPNKFEGHQNSTPQKIKEALFQIAVNFVIPHETIFLDIFAGSGQIGIEAISRNFYSVIFADINKERTRSIKKWLLKDVSSSSYNIMVYQKSALFTLSNILKKKWDKNKFIIFIDPPYSFYTENSKFIQEYVDTINRIKEDNLKYQIFVIIQISKYHLRSMNLSYEYKKYQYGNQCLLLLTFINQEALFA